MKHLIALAAMALLPGCATIMEGSSQSVSVATNPPGASCEINRGTDHLGTISPTPGSAKFEKSKNDITVSCTKDGYQTASVTQSPKFVGTTFGNIVAGGLIGVAVDAASGANYEYPADIHLDMAPAGPATAAAAPSMPVTPAVATAPATVTKTSSAPAEPKHL